MTNKEVIATLRRIKQDHHPVFTAEAFDAAIAALEKETVVKYCPHCGQRLVD